MRGNPFSLGSVVAMRNPTALQFLLILCMTYIFVFSLLDNNHEEHVKKDEKGWNLGGRGQRKLVSVQYDNTFMSFASKAQSKYGDNGIYTRNELCEGIEEQDSQYFSCGNSKTVLLIMQGTMYPSAQGSDKRAYHVLEGLVGLGHNVAVALYGRKKPPQSDEDKMLLSLLDVRYIRGVLKNSLRTVNSLYE